MPDNIQTVTTVFNDKTTFISSNGFNVDSVRIDILDESIKEINSIVQTALNERKFKGKDFTSGNLNRKI